MSDSVIDRTIGFPLGSVKDTLHAFTEPLGSEIYSYSRRENPTIVDSEKAVAKVEGSKWCLLAPCGMSAINIALSIYNDPNDTRPWLFPADAYSGTRGYASSILQAQRGTNVQFADPAGQNSTTANLIRSIESESPALVFIEPISNPTLDIIDIPEVIKAAKRQGAITVIDNTFATSHLIRPLEHGADLVVHSATKYLAGHNNILAGAICGNDPELRQRIISQRNTIGAIISPDDAGRLKTQLQTFHLRVAQQNDNAMKIADFLDKHAGVAKVRYPGLPAHAEHEMAKEMFEGRGFGAMITFDLARDEEGSRKFVDDLGPLIPHIGSLGDVVTTFLHVEACFLEGFSPATIRLSVGIEPAEEIIANLEKALSKT